MVSRVSNVVAPAPTSPRSESVVYLPQENKQLAFVPSGCCVLDNVLGGGWVLGRVENIVGDKSTGKTLLAIEALANFCSTYRDGGAFYRESEAAFDDAYAESLGLPLDRVACRPEELHTVEDWFDDLSDCIKQLKGAPGFYVLDSLDALSSKGEMGRELGAATYGTDKAKAMSEIFRRIVREVRRSRMCLFVVSQVRDKIGVTFGAKYSRSGGHALDFYASHIVYLAHMATLTATRQKEKRAVGVSIKANCTKNKAGLPHRTCEFDILFRMGIDDINASLDFLKGEGVDRIDDILNGSKRDKYVEWLYSLPGPEYRAQMQHVHDVVSGIWREVDARFNPPRRKYE